MPGAAIARILVCLEDPQGSHATGGLPRRGTRLRLAQAPARRHAAHPRLAGQVSPGERRAHGRIEIEGQISARRWLLARLRHRRFEDLEGRKELGNLGLLPRWLHSDLTPAAGQGLARRTTVGLVASVWAGPTPVLS